MSCTLRDAILGFAMVLALSSCESASSPILISALTPSPRVAQTPTVAALGTSAPSPSPLPPPPIPPAPQPSPASPASSSGPELDCKLNWQSPRDGVKYDPRTTFSVRWNVTNTGTISWKPGTVDLVYTHGTRMYFSPIVALEQEVAPGKSVTLTVDMKALRNTSSYITNWSLRRGDTYFCALSLKILVQWSGGFERYD